MDWTPTMYFRWAERVVEVKPGGIDPGFAAGCDANMLHTTVQTLQQAWAPVGGGQIEWRDVPVVSIPSQDTEQ